MLFCFCKLTQRDASWNLQSVNMQKQNAVLEHKEKQHILPRFHFSLCFFFFFASCVDSSHLPSCSITLENLLYKVPRKALLCCLVHQCGLYDSASGGIYSICPEDRWHASVHCGHPPLNRLEQVYTEGRQHKVLWLQILNAMQDEITQIVGVRFCFVLALCVPSLCVISCLPQLPQLASCLLPQQPIVSTCPIFT